MLAKTKTVVTRLEHANGSSKPEVMARELDQVAGALATLRVAVIKEGSGTRTARRAAQGLAQLEDGYRVLARAQTTSDLHERAALVVQAVGHQKAAKADAHAAGPEWPL